jgi:hypothetical protein
MAGSQSEVMGTKCRKQKGMKRVEGSYLLLPEKREVGAFPFYIPCD